MPEPPDPVVVRPVREGDFPQWKVLWDGYNAFYGRVGATALEDRVTQATWSRFLDPSEPMHGLVAEIRGEITGIAHFLLHRSTSQLGPVCYLQDLFTAESARGMGVAGALIEAVAGQAKGLGCARLYWQTHETNATARRLYDRVAVRSGFLVYRKDL